MLLWQPNKGAHESRARSYALWGALIGYLVVLVFLTVAFRVQKPLLCVKLRVGGPAMVCFHGGRPHTGVRGQGASSRALYAAALLSKKQARLQAQKKLKEIKKEKKREAQQKAQDAKKAAQKAAEEAKVKLQKVHVKEAPPLPVAPSWEKAKKPDPSLKNLNLKKKIEPVKKPEPALATPEPEKKEPPSEPVIAEPEPEPVLDGGDEAVVDEEIMVGEEMVDGEASRDAIALMGAVSRVWRPPRGLSKIPQARLIVSVGKDGTVEMVEIDVKSGIVAYDMAARAALWRTVYPPVFWGKRIAVLFGQ